MLFVTCFVCTHVILQEFKHANCTASSPLDTQLATVDKLKTPEAIQIIYELERSKVRNHRKQWEFVYIVQALEHLKLLVPGRRALVFAAGQEPLISYFASKGVHVLATDIDHADAKKKGWVHTNQHSSSKNKLFRPYMLDKQKFDSLVSFQTMDMNHINASIGTFDFVWSTCSLEHVGSIALGKSFALNSARLLKPGGLVVHTTEFTLSSTTRTVEHGATVLWRRADVDELRMHFKSDGFDVSNICLSSGTDEIDRYVDLPPYRSHNHMRLQLGEHAITSVTWTARRSALF